MSDSLIHDNELQEIDKLLNLCHDEASVLVKSLFVDMKIIADPAQS